MAIFIGKTSVNINGNKWSIFHSYLSFVTDMEQQELFPAALEGKVLFQLRQWQAALCTEHLIPRRGPRDLTTIGDSWEQAKKTNGFIQGGAPVR